VELRLTVDYHGFQMSSIARPAGEMLKTVEEWHIALREKGWI
jgi:hypothetical protein